MGKIETTWKRMCFNNNKVWLFSDLDGNPIVNNGKVRIKYQIEQDYEYWIHEKSIKPLSSFSYNRKTKQKGKTAKKHTKKVGQEENIINKDKNKDVINLYTDGASSGNPGPSGIGALLCFGNHEKELSRYIGHATNNVAELEAIKTGLMEIKNREIPVCVYTDSGYAFGVLSLGWKAKKNKDLVKSIKQNIARFSDIRFVKVKGHAGIKENERVDRLATLAIKNRKVDN